MPEFGQDRAAGGTPLGLYYKLNKINCRFVEYKAGQGADNRECGEVRTPFFRPRPWRERGPQRGPMPLRLPPPTGGGGREGEGQKESARPPPWPTSSLAAGGGERNAPASLMVAQTFRVVKTQAPPRRPLLSEDRAGGGGQGRPLAAWLDP